jgi:hypothetical protein
MLGMMALQEGPDHVFDRFSVERARDDDFAGFHLIGFTL